MTNTTNAGELNWSLISKLVIVHIAIIALSNYLVQFPQTVMGISFTWAMFIFPLVIVATDLTIRLSNKHNARWIVAVAYIPAIVISTILADWRIGVASGTAYLIGQLLDVSVFQRIRENISAWWAAPVIATFFSNIIDTYTFFGVAFAGSSDPFMAENWFNIATTDLFFKMIISYVIILPVYGILLTNLLKRFKTE